VLPEHDAVALLRALVGPRVDAEPAHAGALAARCGHLPLALRLAAELAAGRADAPLGDLVADLGTERRRLELLDAGGAPGAVRAVFGWSVRHLSPSAARAFAVLGLHPGRHFEEYAAAALIGVEASHARRMLDELARSHIVTADGSGRYAMHDLMRAYAAERATTEIAPEQAHTALTRLFDFHLAAAAAAVVAAFPYLRDSVGDRVGHTIELPALNSAAAAQRWLDAERPTLVTFAQHGDGAWGRRKIELSRTLFRYLGDQGHHAEALIVHGVAVIPGAGHSGEILANLASTLHYLGRVEEAAECLRRALASYRTTGDLAGEARALNNLGGVDLVLGRYDDARRHIGQALSYHRASGDRLREAWTMLNLGIVSERLGLYTRAETELQEALAISQRLGDRSTEGYVLGSLGELYANQDRLTEAAGLIRKCAAIAAEFNDHGLRAQALAVLANILLRQGRHREALDQLDAARVIADAIGDRLLRLSVLNGLGETALAMHDGHTALARHRSALALARRIGDPYELARALDGMAGALHHLGHTDRAHRNRDRALSIYNDLGVPEAHTARREPAVS
jgi:tetratricopeptide (TPR) repeat protein